MKELSLQELKEIEFDILKVFDAFCKEHHIRYFLAHGTLLGAIRYKKFIPWDDDVDVLVPREDYERLLTLFQDTERYRLFAFEKDLKFLFPYAKLCDMTTRKEESVVDNGLALGVDMDIFPLDAWGNDPDKARRDAKRAGRYMMCLGLSRCQKPASASPVKWLVKGCLMILCKMLGSTYFVRKLIQQSKQIAYDGSAYLGNKAWSVYGDRDIMPAEVFADTVEVEFEGELFPAPVDYDKFLTCLYGDYLPEPPKEKQKTHHSFRAYRV